MALSVSCKCCTLVSASAVCCGYLCSNSCQHEAVTHVIEPCALIPDSVHMCYTLIPGLLCHPSHSTDCPSWEYDDSSPVIRCLTSNLTHDGVGREVQVQVLSNLMEMICIAWVESAIAWHKKKDDSVGLRKNGCQGAEVGG